MARNSTATVSRDCGIALIRWAGCCAIALIAQCVSPRDPVSGSGLGVIRGVIVPSLYAEARIDGTNLSAQTDTSGRFALYGIPNGEYLLRIGASLESGFRRDSLVNIQMSGDSVVDLDTINLTDLRSLDFCYPAGYYLLVVESSPDCAKIGTAGALQPLAGVFFSPAAEVIVTARVPGTAFVMHGGKSVAMGLDSVTAVIRRTGNDTVTLARTSDGGCGISVVILDTSRSAVMVDSSLARRVKVTTAPLSLYKTHTADNPSLNRAVLGSDTLELAYGTAEHADWDIYLVNDSLNDTCYWGNRNPCWSGRAAECWGSPVFSGDHCNGASISPECTSFESDRIVCNNPPDGVYSILVRFVACVDDCGSARPTLTIEAGTNGPMNYISHLFQYSPPRALVTGETWFAGTVSIPECTYRPADDIMAAGMGKSTKMR